MKSRTKTGLVFAAAIVLVIAVVSLLFLKVYYRRYGTIRSTSEINRIAKRGVPIVTAIEEFKHDNGLYPQYLDDLAPKYLKEVPSKTWGYGWEYEHFNLSYGKNWGYYFVFFDSGFRGADLILRDRGWRVFRQGGGLAGGKGARELQNLITAVQLYINKPPLPKEQLLQNTLAELDRRISREPSNIFHYVVKASFLYHNGKLDEARSVCEKAMNIDTKYWNWWPRMTLAYIDSKAGRGDESLKKYIEWADANPDYENYFYLHVLYRALGQKENALAALNKAMQHLKKVFDHNQLSSLFVIPNSYPRTALNYAYAQKDYQLALKILDAWQKTNDRHYSVVEFDKARAAIYFKLGKIEEMKQIGLSKSDMTSIENGHSPSFIGMDNSDKVRIFADFGEGNNNEK